MQVNSSSHQNVTYSLENDNCSSSPLGNVDFHDPRILGSLLPLGLLCVIVILGNIMVIVAVKITHKLRGATNLFIGEKHIMKSSLSISQLELTYLSRYLIHIMNLFLNFSLHSFLGLGRFNIRCYCFALFCHQ